MLWKWFLIASMNLISRSIVESFIPFLCLLDVLQTELSTSFDKCVPWNSREELISFEV